MRAHVSWILCALLTLSCDLFSKGGNFSTETSTTSPSVPAETPSSPIVEDPISTTFIYRADSSNNKIYFGSLDAVTGELAEHGSIDMGAGENPVSLVVSIDKKYLFVAKAGTNKIDTYEIDQDSGEINLIHSTSTYFSPISKIFIDPLNRFLWSYEGQRIISYVIEANGSLTGASTTALADNGRALAVDSQGEYIYLGIGSSGVRSYQIDPVTGKPSNAGSLYGSAPNALVVSPTSDRLFGAPSDFGDKVLSFTIDSGTGDIDFEKFLNGGQLPAFQDITINPDGDHIYLLSESPAQVKSMTIDTSGGLTGSVLNNVALSSGCAPKSMSYLKDENFIVTGCSDGSGKTSTLKIEADGSLTLKDTSVVGGMKIDSIVFVTF